MPCHNVKVDHSISKYMYTKKNNATPCIVLIGDSLCAVTIAST